MPAIEFACPHCDFPTRVPADLAGKQGRCSSCKRVIEVPDVPPVSSRASGRSPLAVTPDPGRVSGRTGAAPERRPSTRASAAHPGRSSDVGGPAQGRPSEAGGVDEARRSGGGRVDRARRARPPSGAREADPAPPGDPEHAEDEASTGKVDVAALVAQVDARGGGGGGGGGGVPRIAWVAVVLTALFPAIGVGVSLFAIKEATRRGRGVGLAWGTLLVGVTIFVSQLLYLVSGRSKPVLFGSMAVMLAAGIPLVRRLARGAGLRGA